VLCRAGVAQGSCARMCSCVLLVYMCVHVCEEPSVIHAFLRHICFMRHICFIAKSDIPQGKHDEPLAVEDSLRIRASELF
jgi:hypothetical protein